MKQRSQERLARLGIVIGILLFFGLLVLVLYDDRSSDPRIRPALQKLTGENNLSFQLVGQYDTVFRVSAGGKTILAGCITRDLGDPVCELIQ